MSAVSRQRPAFHGQNASSTSNTTSTAARYARASSAAPSSTSRTYSESRSLMLHRRTSETRCRTASSTGRFRASTVDVRSIAKRNRHNAAYAAGSSADRSSTAIRPLGPAASQSGLMRNVEYPTTSPARSASRHCSGDAPCRALAGSISALRSQPGPCAGVPGRPATSCSYTPSHAAVASSGLAYRRRTSSVPSGTASRTRSVSISRDICFVAAPYPNRP